MRPRMILCLVLLGAVQSSLARAQASPEEQARRLLEDGRAYLKEGKAKQALDNFNTVVSGFSSTEVVDDALLEIGRYRLEVEQDSAKARESFEQVAKRFPQSDSAPGAYFYLGWLVMNRSSDPADLEDAVAQFGRVERLYSGSEWVPKALHAMGQVYRKSGRWADAVDVERRVSWEYPSSDVAPAAQFLVGHNLALMGEPRLAMEEFQQVRNRFPETEWAARALDRLTGLYRLYAAGKPTFQFAGPYPLSGGEILKDVGAILMTPDRTLWVASGKVNGAVPFTPEGKAGPSITVEEVHTLSLGPRNEVVVAAKTAVRVGPRDIRSFSVPTEKPGVSESLEKITAAVALSTGDVLVADEKRKKIFRFDAKSQPKGTFPDSQQREAIRMIVDGEGTIVLLDRDSKSVSLFDGAGHPLRTIAARGVGYELKHPVDIAVDAVRNLYVADEENGVFVFSAQGALLTTLTAAEMRRPKALTLDPSGGVLVYDGKLEQVVRFK